MALVIKLTAPSGEKYFGSRADSEGLRYLVSQMGDAEIFSSREAADNAIFALRQVRELRDYSCDIVEV
jgi:hypothetical protein